MATLTMETKKGVFTYDHINKLCSAAAKANNASDELILMYETPTSIQFDNGNELHVFSKPAYYFK